MGMLREDQGAFVISCLILLRMRNVSDRSCREIKTHILCSVTVFLLENRAVYEVMYKNMVGPDRLQVTTIWCLCITYWIT